MAPKSPAPKQHGAELSSAESAAPKWPSPYFTTLDGCDSTLLIYGNELSKMVKYTLDSSFLLMICGNQLSKVSLTSDLVDKFQMSAFHNFFFRYWYLNEKIIFKYFLNDEDSRHQEQIQCIMNTVHEYTARTLISYILVITRIHATQSYIWF